MTVIKIADYFIVALKILEFEENGERVWFAKLVESLSKKFSRGKVGKLLNILEDWLIVSSEYGETSPGHAGRLYFLSKMGKKKIQNLRMAKS